MFGNQKIFVSHTHEDYQRCQPLLAAFDAWQLDYWFDLQELGAGQRFSDRIEQELGDRDILIRVGTTAAMHSFWMNRELRAIRGVQAAMPQHPRLIVHLILTPEYVLDAPAHHEVVIDTTKSPRATWLREVHQALGLTPTVSTGQRIGRRAAIGIGALSLAALATSGTAAALHLKHPPTIKSVGFSPTGPASTATPQPLAQRLRWQYATVFDKSPPGNAYVASDATGVYISNNNTIAVYARNASDGKAIWTYPSNNSPEIILNGGSIVISTDTVYVMERHYTGTGQKFDYLLIAIDKAAGTEKWRVILGDDNLNSSNICLTANALYLQNLNQILAFGLDGKLLWPPITLAPNDINSLFVQDRTSTPWYANGVIYVGSVNGKLYAIDATKGSIHWSTQVTPLSLKSTEKFPNEDASMIETGIIVANGLVFVGANDGQLRAFDAETGALRWSTEIIPHGAVTGTSKFETLSTPLVADGVVYLTAGRSINYDAGLDTNPVYPTMGQLFAVNAASGKILWMLDPVKELSLQNYVATPNANGPIIQDSTVYFPIALAATSQGNIQPQLGINALFAVNKSTGAVQWHYEVQINGVISATFPYYPAASLITPGGVVLASNDGKISVLNTVLNT